MGLSLISENIFHVGVSVKEMCVTMNKYLDTYSLPVKYLQ